MSRGSKLFATASAAFVAAVLSLAATAHAQYAPPPATGPYAPTPAPRYYEGGFPWRTGFTAGVGLGFGDLSCDCVPDNSDENHLESVSFHFHLGGMLNPRFALMFDGWGLGHPDRTYYDATLTHVIGTVAARWWATPMLWLQGGLGYAQLAWHVDGDTPLATDSRPAAMIAVGYEVLHAPNFAVDIDLRIGSGFYEDATVTNVAIGGAVNWY